ncbi:MAG: hypothetical protein ACWGOY_01545 [Anaerolineales bacterium]
MNRGQLIGGIICLALAILLAILNSTLPEEDLMLMIGGQNMPWVGPLILGGVGAILLLSAFTLGREPAERKAAPEIKIDPDKAALNKRLEAIGWGLFLVMLGGFILVPGDQFPKGWWSIGVGVIMLGLNVARYFNHIRMSGFTTFLGLVAIISGILELAGLDMLGGALFLIILGAYIIIKPWFDKRQLFGKAEES